MPKRIVILQDAISAYRKPFFNALAEHYEVVVVHSGASAVDSRDRFREVCCPVRRVGGFVLQPVREHLQSLQPMKAVVAMFDLRWVNTWFEPVRVRGTRRLLWGHRYSHRVVGNAVRDRVMRLYDGVIQYADDEVDAMVARGLPRERIFVAPNTIHVENHADTSHMAKRSLLYVGRLQPRKRLDELIDAFADVIDTVPSDTQLEILGDGEIRAELRAQAARRGLADRVHFHDGSHDPVTLKECFARAYAYVSPDCVGLGVLHAFAYGVPVVTCTHRDSHVTQFRHGPEFSNLRNGENALLFSTPEGLRQHLSTLVNDVATARRLGHAAYQHFVAGRLIQHMVAGFREAIEWPDQPAALDTAVRGAPPR